MGYGLYKEVTIGVNSELTKTRDNAEETLYIPMHNDGIEFEAYMERITGIERDELYIIPGDILELDELDSEIRKRIIRMGEDTYFYGEILEDSEVEKRFKTLEESIKMLMASRLTSETLLRDYPGGEEEIIRDSYFTIYNILDAYRRAYGKYSVVPTNVRKHLDIFALTVKEEYDNIGNDELDRIDSLFNI